MIVQYTERKEWNWLGEAAISPYTYLLSIKEQEHPNLSLPDWNYGMGFFTKPREHFFKSLKMPYSASWCSRQCKMTLSNAQIVEENKDGWTKLNISNQAAKSMKSKEQSDKLKK